MCGTSARPANQWSTCCNFSQVVARISNSNRRLWLLLVTFELARSSKKAGSIQKQTLTNQRPNVRFRKKEHGTHVDCRGRRSTFAGGRRPPAHMWSSPRSLRLLTQVPSTAAPRGPVGLRGHCRRALWPYRIISPITHTQIKTPVKER